MSTSTSMSTLARVRRASDTYVDSCSYHNSAASAPQQQAIFTRLIFSLHALLAIWQVTRVTNSRYWLLVIAYSGLLVETFVVLLKRRGQEWRWFQFSIFLFICTTVPPIWILELNKLGRWGNRLNVTSLLEADSDDAVAADDTSV